jgi:hypothetical protein
MAMMGLLGFLIASGVLPVTYRDQPRHGFSTKVSWLLFGAWLIGRSLCSRQPGVGFATGHRSPVSKRRCHYMTPSCLVLSRGSGPTDGMTPVARISQVSAAAGCLACRCYPEVDEPR